MTGIGAREGLHDPDGTSAQKHTAANHVKAEESVGPEKELEFQEFDHDRTVTPEDSVADHQFQFAHCPVKHASVDKMKVNMPLQAKKFSPTGVKPSVLQKPGEQEMSEWEYDEIVDVPVGESLLTRVGKWFGPLNLVPFYNAMLSLINQSREFQKFQAYVPDAPCIRGNIGLDCVLVTKNTAMHWLLSQSPDNVERDDNHFGFGPFGVNRYYIGRSLPALIASERNGHAKLREHVMMIFRARLPDIDSTVERTFTYRLNQLIDDYKRDPSCTNLMTGATWLCAYFASMWVLGVEPDNKMMEDFGSRALGRTNTDNWLGEFLGQLLDDIVFNLDGSYRREDRFLKLARSSRYYKQYEKFAKELGVETKDLDRSLTFLVCLNGNLGITLPFSCFVACIGENLGSLSQLRAELGMDHLTIESVSDAKKYPLLDSCFWEVARCFIRGFIVPRRAKKDLLMPGGNGKAYRIKKHDLMLGYHALANRDESKFEDPFRFNPRRFLDNPDLKKYVFAFGIPHEFDPKHVVWGCPIRSCGFGEQLLKVFIGKWVQRVDWTLAHPPEIMGEAIGEYRPYHIPFSKLKYRQAYLDSLK